MSTRYIKALIRPLELMLYKQGLISSLAYANPSAGTAGPWSLRALALSGPVSTKARDGRRKLRLSPPIVSTGGSCGWPKDYLRYD